MGDLDLETREGFLKGGKHGAPVIAGNAAESRLYKHLTGQLQPLMPFGGHLTAPQIALFKAWIDAGAEWDAKTPLSSGVKAFTAAQKSYWLFQPVSKPAVPKSGDARNAIDAFIEAKLQEKGIHRNPAADKVTLLRRASIDLTGLPPTPEEAQAFLADGSPNAFAKVVDRLLASPQYGERWGRNWLDVARYADTNGFKADEIRPNIWRYRDYVIGAFNKDKPYDRFIREQIAGDELYPESVEAHIATGFLRHYTDETNQPSMEQRREELLMNITDTVSSAFMGMTYGCAKCHDHKFDPILHKDYYRLQAFFANVRANDEYIPLTGADLENAQAQQTEWEAKTKDIRAAMHALVADIGKAAADEYMLRFFEGTREAIQTPPQKRTPYQALLAFQGLPQVTHTDVALSKELKGEQKKQFNELAAQLKQFDSIKPNPPLAQTMIDNGPQAPPTFVLAGGSWNAPKEEVQPGFLSILDSTDAKFSAPNGTTTGRRTALANWLAGAKNPLTARVMVNRVWQGHFGTGIVASSSDFGIMGDRPSNPELLDYLAATFVENGWSMKALHRAIMLSDTYQESSLTNEAAATADPDNRLLWRFPRHRAEGEVVRDAMLHTSGRLNLKMGGPGVRPELPEGVNTEGYAAWAPEKDAAEARRRSVYVFVKRVLTYPMFEAFDAPTSEDSCPRRFSTVQPSQALMLMNDKFVLDWSREFAGRVLNDSGLSSAQQIERAYRLALSRPPNTEEGQTVARFLENQSNVIAARLERKEAAILPDHIPAGMDPAKAAAFVDFCHALMMSNEFLYIKLMIDQLRHRWNVSSRREFFTRAGSGLAGIALASMLAEDAAAAGTADPLALKKPHHTPTAKSVIFLFMEGGPSHVDLFDYKPLLQKLDGQPVPESIGKPKQTAQGAQNNNLMAPKRVWKQRGRSGMWVSDWYENTGAHVDDMTIVRSCWADGVNHVGSVCQMNTGSILAGRPSMGAWTSYGLGTANKNLPSFVVMTDDKDPVGGTNNWSSGFLPAVYQGTQFRRGGTPILDLKPPATISDEQERNQLGLLRSLNDLWSRDKAGDSELDARIRSYEMAYQMQSSASEAVDLTKESEATRNLYGLDDPATAVYGGNCLMARRLVERGVRFVELYCGSGSGWDAHQHIESNHGKWCRASDKPIAGLLTDLKQRGLLKDTLVVWGGEFGRTPFNQQGDGRDHNPWGFTMFMAGGGAKQGAYVGTTDEIGMRAQERPVHVHDIHATILWMLGLDHMSTTFLHNGRNERPTVLAGEVVKDILA